MNLVDLSIWCIEPKSRAIRQRARRTPRSPELELFLATRSKGTCSECGETDPGPILTKYRICYECFLRRKGRPTTEFHHVFGRPEKPEIEIPGNLHRAIDRRRDARITVLKQRHGGDRLIRAAQTLITAAELSEALCLRARHKNYVQIAMLCDVGERCRKTAHWLLALHHRFGQTTLRSAVRNLDEGGYHRFELLERVQVKISPLIGIAAFCRDLAARRIFALIDSADEWAVPAAQLGNAIARRLRDDAGLLLEIDHELVGSFGLDWYNNEELPKWLI